VAVYIIAPAGAYTGGPTALFQLCYALRKNGVNAIMAFYGEINDNPVHPNYERYECPWITVNNIKNGKDVTVITPETAINQVNSFTKIKKIVYWLAVDNYVSTIYKPSKLGFILHIIKNYMFDPYVAYAYVTRNIHIYHNAYKANYIKLLIDKKKISVPHNIDFHLAQSRYAKDFLSSYGIKDDKVIMIHEPLEKEFLSKATKIKYDEKIDAVAWNARKAYPIAFRLVKMLRKRGLTVFDLKNLGKDRMIKVLSRTKIFIDIGIHPGRDRPLREAVVLDNIAIINNHGGYYHYDDCMIPTEFKLNCYLDFDRKINYHKLCTNIEHYLENFEYYIKKFHHFKQYIMQEPYIFLSDVKHLSKILMEHM